MLYTYVLLDKKRNFYIGYTSDLKKRFKEHNSGESKATKPYRPYKLIFYEAFLNRIDAKRREDYLIGEGCNSSSKTWGKIEMV